MSGACENMKFANIDYCHKLQHSLKHWLLTLHIVLPRYATYVCSSYHLHHVPSSHILKYAVANTFLMSHVSVIFGLDVRLLSETQLVYETQLLLEETRYT